MLQVAEVVGFWLCCIASVFFVETPLSQCNLSPLRFPTDVTANAHVESVEQLDFSSGKTSIQARNDLKTSQNIIRISFR